MKEITSVHNAAVQLLRELQKPRARRENGLFVCESAKLVGEAVTLRLAQALFIEKGCEAEYAPMIGQAESAGCELYVVSTAVMQAVSTAKTPQGVVCTARIPSRRRRWRGGGSSRSTGCRIPATSARFCARRMRRGLTARSSAQAARISTAQRR